MLQIVSNWMTTDAIKHFFFKGSTFHCEEGKSETVSWIFSLAAVEKFSMNIAAVCLVWVDMFMQKTQ